MQDACICHICNVQCCVLRVMLSQASVSPIDKVDMAIFSEHSGQSQLRLKLGNTFSPARLHPVDCP